MRIHSALSSKCHIQTSKISGSGVFAKEAINKGEMVAVWGGVIYSKKDLIELSKEHPDMLTHPFGVYKDYYMGPLNPGDPIDDAETFNHSCDANAGVKGQIIVVARKDIKAGEEVCFNYETVEIDPACLGFDCKCGTKNCHRLIDGSAWKNPEFRKEYEGFFSSYVQDLIGETPRN